MLQNIFISIKIRKYHSPIINFNIKATIKRDSLLIPLPDHSVLTSNDIKLLIQSYFINKYKNSPAIQFNINDTLYYTNTSINATINNHINSISNLNFNNNIPTKTLDEAMDLDTVSTPNISTEIIPRSKIYIFSINNFNTFKLIIQNIKNLTNQYI